MSKIVSFPLQGLDKTTKLESQAPMNMDGLHLVSPPFITASKVHPRKLLKGPRHDVIYSVKSFPTKRPNGRYQSENRAPSNKVTKSNELKSNSSSQGSLNSSMSSATIPKSTLFIENSKVDRATKRNSKRKARKKGKQKKKVAHDSIYSAPEVLFKDFSHSSFPSETCVNNDADLGDGLVLYATSTEDLYSEDRGSVTNLEGNNKNIRNFFESRKTCVPFLDEVDVSDKMVPSTVENSSGEHSVIDSELTTQFKDKEFSSIDKVGTTHRLLVSAYDVSNTDRFSVTHDCQGVDAASIGSVSGNSTTTSCDSKICDKDSYSPPKLQNFSSRKAWRNSFSGVVDIYNYSKGTRHDNRNFNGSTMQVIAPSKRNKQNKPVLKTSRTSGNLHGRIGKENNHSVWKKVQKNEADEFNSQFKKVSPVCSQAHASVKEACLLRSNSKITKVDTLAKASDKKQPKDKVTGKLRRKTNPGSKKEYGSYSWRGFNPSKAKSNSSSKIGITENRSSNVSHSSIGFQEMGLRSSGAETSNPESFYGSQDWQGNDEAVESAHKQQSSMEKSCFSLERLNLHGVRSLVYLPHLIVHEAAQMEKDVSLTEYYKENYGSGSILQKWIPIGTRDPGSTTSSRCDIFSSENSDRQGTSDWTLGNNGYENAASDSQSVVSSLNVGMMSMDLGSEISSSQEDENDTQKLKNNHSTFKENKDKHSPFNCLTGTFKEENFSAVESGLDNIVEAVNSSCRMQLASEAICVATGRPLAEFERLLHCCSPAVCHSTDIMSCMNCSLKQVVGASLCRHETPNISLGCLWQWYEKHGSYGLEIRAEEYEQSKRLGIDRFSFRAYFVPFLSAVQLFRNCKSDSIVNADEVTSTGIPEACETAETSENSSNSNVANLPIYSLLVPQPRTSDTSVKEVCEPGLSSASIGEDLHVPLVDKTCSDDSELLFEYFESEPPQQRRPLYEKIQELVRGDGPSRSKGYGDPTNLNSTNLHDLHPGSWYSVAWYPIYRIPDGNLRAAFLTYHSLGHMIHRSASFDSCNVETSVVSPVVGLQSYNAQSECWFQLRQSAQSQSAQSQTTDPCGILRERLRTLEETASLMARAVVNKGNETSMNRHPDYEFFLSRRRY